MTHKIIHIVPHTHWDREWYFTSARSKVYLLKDLSDVLDELENDARFTSFMLDAQASLLEDYLAWKPDDRRRIQRLISDNRLIVGPWYTQSDQMLISGESIVRNLYYGIKICRDLGGYMNVGYVPDSFGQSGNMPQIYAGFEITDVLFWRGASDDTVQEADFIWRGDDGSELPATQMVEGYSLAGKMMVAEEFATASFWHEARYQRVYNSASTKHVYLPLGFDQTPIRPDLPDLVAKRNVQDSDNTYIISRATDYLQAVREAHKPRRVVQGELLEGKYMRVHRSIYSSRADLKTFNTKVQNYITQIVEPTLTLSFSLGNEYPHRAMEQIWKMLFENAAHDSIGSCVTDKVNANILARYKQALDISENLVELHMRLMATAIADAEDYVSVTVFNYLPVPRREIVTTTLYMPGEPCEIVDVDGNQVTYSIIEAHDVSEYVKHQTKNMTPQTPIYIPQTIQKTRIAFDTETIPAMGFKRFLIRPIARMKVFPQESSLKSRINDMIPACLELSTLHELENEFYSIAVTPQGTLNVTDKCANRTYSKQACLVESGDAGDSFNYSPPREDYIVRGFDDNPHVEIIGSSIWQQATITGTMTVPADLKERSQGICTVIMPVELHVTLTRGTEAIDVTVSIDNQAFSHKLCLEFDAGIATTYNYADEQFGCIRRENVHTSAMERYWRGERGEDPVRWQERPVSIEPLQSYVALFKHNQGIALFPDGVREYEIVGENHNRIALTLMRTYDFMGKSDLVYRPGRASGESTCATPDAQLLGHQSFHLNFSTLSLQQKEGTSSVQQVNPEDLSSFDNLRVDMLARSCTTPLVTYEYAAFLNGRLIFSEMPVHGSLDPIQSLFSSEGRLIMSACKKWEEGNGYIVRLYNGLYDSEVDDILHVNRKVIDAFYTDLQEQKISEAMYRENDIFIKPLKRCQFVTLCVVF